MSGNFSCHNSYTISVKKAKLLSKIMGMTFNDLIMGLTSKVLKQYFVSCLKVISQMRSQQLCHSVLEAYLRKKKSILMGTSLWG